MPTLDFKGKPFVYSHHLSVPFRELIIDEKKSLPGPGGPSLDDNLIIHGDNLEALKALLPRYAGKVDVIYIDPPYNTGNEGWAYNDNVNSPLMKSWFGQSVGEDDLERHDKWLSMMWPRLQLLAELLSPNGSLWISIDDNEAGKLKQLIDEIIGPEKFVAQIVWQRRTSRENRAAVGTSHEYLLLYTKCGPESWKGVRNRLEGTENGYSNPDNDPKGVWRSIPFSAQGFRKNQVYPIKAPSGELLSPPRGRSWGATEPVFERFLKEGRVYFPKDGEGRPRIKQYPEEEKGLVPSTLWFANEVGDNEEAKKEVLSIFSDGDAFDTPKPRRLIQRLIQIGTKPNSLVLDSFAGSGTTAHAVLAENAKDGGKRRFILVECESYADDITAERVRRVIAGYRAQDRADEELYRVRLNFDLLQASEAVLSEVAEVSERAEKRFASIRKEIRDGHLVVYGEYTEEKAVDGVSGTYTYCTLGAPIDLERFFEGHGAPQWEQVARYVAYTATGQTLTDAPKKPGKDWYVGEAGGYRIHLIYKPDLEFMRSNKAALDMTTADRIRKAAEGKSVLVYAAAKFMSQKDLSERGITFCQLPYSIHRILGDGIDEA
jgi:adenine-specific DNA-methyltransferase